MKLLKKKKGFTIVELVIVIAVIAVLAAVLIPTFINLTSKADKASDESLVTSLNKALAIEEVDHEVNNMHDAVESLKREGYLASTLVTKSDQKLLYNLEENRFLLEEDKKQGVSDLEYWTIQDSYDSSKQQYSIYASDNFSNQEVEGLKVGFDAGDCSTISNINYVGGEDAQSVIVRTNGGNLTIDAEYDTVNHYGEGLVLDIKAIADSSYHEFGHFPKAEIKKGRIVVENNGQVEILNVTGTGVILDKASKGTVDLCYASSNDYVPSGNSGVQVTVADIDLDSIVARTSTGAYETLAAALDNLGTSNSLYIVADINETFVSSDYALYHINNPLTIEGQGRTINVQFVVDKDSTKIFLELNAETAINNLNINSTGIKYVIVASDVANFNNLNISADNAGISAAQKSATEFGHITARNSIFRFTKGEYTRNDYEESWAPVSTQQGSTVDLFDCTLNSSDGYGMLVWPSGGTINANRCKITSAKGYAISWSRNGATSTYGDSVVNINNSVIEGSSSCEAKYSSSAPTTVEAYVYKDNVLVATTAA